MQTGYYYAQELIKKLYPGATPDKKLSEQAAYAAVAQACDEIRLIRYLRGLDDPEIGDVVPSGWLTYFGVQEGNECEVKCDNAKRYYINLPATPINIGGEKAFRRIWPSDRPEIDIKILRPGFRQTYGNTEIGDLGGRIGVYRVHKRMYFTEALPGDSKTVDIEMMASAQTLPMDYQFPADGSIVNEMLKRAEEVWFPQKQIPEDPINDGVSQ